MSNFLPSHTSMCVDQNNPVGDQLLGSWQLLMVTSDLRASIRNLFSLLNAFYARYTEFLDHSTSLLASQHSDCELNVPTFGTGQFLLRQILVSVPLAYSVQQTCPGFYMSSSLTVAGWSYTPCSGFFCSHLLLATSSTTSLLPHQTSSLRWSRSLVSDEVNQILFRASPVSRASSPAKRMGRSFQHHFTEHQKLESARCFLTAYIGES